MKVAVRDFVAADFDAVQRIYQAGIDTGNATFQPRARSREAWDASMLPSCRLVAVSGDTVVGWAGLSAVSSRPVYSGVAEVSVYVAPEAQGAGVGLRLLGALVQASEEAGFWTLQAGIFPENIASLRLHARHGFRIVGSRERLGRMAGRWRDVVLLERRSAEVGA